jgi:serine/threonine protein kinase
MNSQSKKIKHVKKNMSNLENEQKSHLKRDIIGEGAYGCVHKPSIHCKNRLDPEINYNDYVSKLMKTKNAEKELKEFLFIGKIDPNNNYHLGEPIMCRPNLDDDSIISEINECKHINKTDFISNPNNYSLLVIKYGGPDLKAFCQKNLVTYFKENKEEKLDQFWLEVHHLLKGIKFFKENGIVHNDIKPQNILFDLKTAKMKFIDFGLMRKKTDIINLSKKNKNNLGIFHWSYPFDCAFMNKEKFNKYLDYSKKTRNQYENEVSELIISKSKINTLDIPMKNPDAFNIIFTYLNPNFNIPDSITKYSYIHTFFQGFNQMISNNSYNKILDYTIDSIDVFGLGFTLQFMTNCFKIHKLISLQDYTRFTTFFHKMYNFNPLLRVINIDVLLNEYENILLEIGVLTRVKKYFKNNLLSSNSFKETIDSTKKLSEKNNNRICPNDKEINPKTLRCVKKCKPGFSRNNKFLCRKTRKSKSTSSHI